MEITTKQAMDKLTYDLMNDDSYYNSWKSNIAMEIYDYMENAIKPNNETTKEMSNVIANNFLNKFIGYKTISIHFTIKDQPLEKIKSIIENPNNKKLFNKYTTIYHCFLPREEVIKKGYETSLVDLIDDIPSKYTICYYQTENDIDEQRDRMLNNIKNGNPENLAVFIGDIKEGVKKEYDLATEKGIEIIHLT